MRSLQRSPYSNPTRPEICPFLVLGIVLLSREIFHSCDSIILGTKLDENINIWLRSVPVAAAEDPEDAIVGVNGTHLTSHCTRKGSTSYVVSLPGLSNVIACWLRVGWQLGGVLPTYIIVESGGDQTVGRTVSGLLSGELYYLRDSSKIQQLNGLTLFLIPILRITEILFRIWSQR